MSQQVFAYGSNMCSGRFRNYGVSSHGTGRAAVLTGYRLLFNKRSTKDGSGKANIEPRAGCDVWGVLYTVSDAGLQRLDDGEVGYYRVWLRVQTPDGTGTEAWVYVASAPDSDPALRPYTWYRRFLVEGGREHSLPANYVAALEVIEAVEDPDPQRDRQQRALVCGAPVADPTASRQQLTE